MKIRIFWIVMAAFAFAMPRLTWGQSDPPQLRVLTYNIHHGEAMDGEFDYERLAKVITDLNPDVVALQEVDRGTRRASGVDQPALLERLTGMKSVFGHALIYQGGEYGEALLSRWPVDQVRAYHLPFEPHQEPRTALAARIKPDNELPEFIFVGTHLDHTTNETRLKQTQRINRVLPSEGGLPVILAGDLNARPGSDPMNELLAERWVDAIAPQSRIDYVLFRAGDPWKVVEVNIIDERVVSDHRPVLAVLEWMGGVKTRPDAEPVDLDLRVMTFNVRNGAAADDENHWNFRQPIVADVLKSFKPDLVGLQESSWEPQLEALDQFVPNLRLLRIEGQGEGRRNSILYRTDKFTADEYGIFWYSDTPEVFSTHWGNSYPRSCTWARFIDKSTGRGFYHFNTHLDHQSQNSRIKSAQMLIRRIAGRKFNEPFIVTGDFNTAEDNPVVLYLKGERATDLEGNQLFLNSMNLIDTFRILHPDTSRVRTAHSFRGGAEGNKIDYIWTSATSKVFEAQIIRTNLDGRYPSDHYPVTGVIRLPRS